MRLLVVLLLLTLLLTVHIARADEKQSGDKGTKGSDGEETSKKGDGDNGVGPVKNPHCKKAGRGPDPHGDGHGPPKKTECDDDGS